jgi:hypothetical protein
MAVAGALGGANVPPRELRELPALGRRLGPRWRNADHHVADAVGRHRGPDHVRGSRREEAERRTVAVHREHEDGAGVRRAGIGGGRGGPLELQLGHERRLPVPRDPRAGEHRKRQCGGGDDCEPPARLERVPQTDEPECREDRDDVAECDEPVGRKAARHEREHDAPEEGQPPRPEKPAGKPPRVPQARHRERYRRPLDVAGPTVHEPVEVRAAEHVGQSRPPEEAVARGVDRERSGPDLQGEQGGAEESGGADRRAERANGLGAFGSPCERGLDHQDQRPEREEQRVREPSRGEQERGADRPLPARTGEHDGCREEQRREGDVCQIAGREVDGEGSGQHAGEQPARPGPRRQVANERRGSGPDRGGEHALERSEDGRQRDPQPLEHEPERRDPGPLGGRQPIEPRELRPPHIDGSVRPERQAQRVQRVGAEEEGHEHHPQAGEKRAVGASL